MRPSPEYAVQSLIQMSAFGGPGGTEGVMAKYIQEVERDFSDSGSWRIHYWLGIATRNYVVWFSRGDSRKPFLHRAVEHFETAYKLSQGKLPEELPSESLRSLEVIDRAQLSGEIGNLLISEAQIRDLEKGMEYLRITWERTINYHPLLCSYPEGYYKLGEYERAAQVALELDKRARRSPECIQYGMPTSPLASAAKANRALGEVHKKQGRNQEAIAAFQRIVDLDLATDNDRQVLNALRNRL